MKRIVTIGLALLVVLLIPAGLLTAQEKKSEQHIKIVVADKSGTSVVIDTLINGHISTDSIKLKNGEIIVFAKHDGAGKVKFITEEGEKGEGGKVITWSSSSSTSSTSGDSKSMKYIYISDDKDSGKSGEKTYDVRVTEDEKDSNMEKTKYVIAKDGIVVSIEGNDESKVKDLIKDVESKLGVTDDKKVEKEETKKTTKK
jgi:hypothetical protein